MDKDNISRILGNAPFAKDVNVAEVALNILGGGGQDINFTSILQKVKEKEDQEYFQEGTELTEALKPADKKVVDAFYNQDSLVDGKLLSTDGKSLEKHGTGGQTIAVWLKDKIAITAVSDVKSTEVILNYMKKSIPKNNFDPKSYKKFFEGIEGTWVEIPKSNEKDEYQKFKESTKLTEKQIEELKIKVNGRARALKGMESNSDWKGALQNFSEMAEKVIDYENTLGAPFKDLKNVADAALKIMTGQPQEVKEEEKEGEEVTKKDQPQPLTE